VGARGDGGPFAILNNERRRRNRRKPFLIHMRRSHGWMDGWREVCVPYFFHPMVILLRLELLIVWTLT